MTVTPIYAGLLALLYVALAAQVIRYRRRNRVSLGDGGQKELAQLVRAHGNCAEYGTLGIVLLALVELQGTAPALAVHGLGCMLLVGRILHGYAFSRFPMVMGLRVPGMALTLFMIVFSALALLAGALI
ncbi:MAG: MAPEG family protein [Pseudomonadota bacterium]